MKYIDADKLIAEIESRMEDCKLPDGKFPTTTSIVRYEELSCLRNFISSLQQEQPEVDLDMEIKKMLNSDYYKRHIKPSPYTIDLINYTARYFYSLGLNARKEE